MHQEPAVSGLVRQLEAPTGARYALPGPACVHPPHVPVLRPAFNVHACLSTTNQRRSSQTPQTGPSQDGRTRCVSCPANAICSARIVGTDLAAPALPPDTASTAATLLSSLNSRLDAARTGASPSRRLQEQLPATLPTTPALSAATDFPPTDAMEFLARLRALLGPEVELGDLEELAMGQEQRVDAAARAAASTLLRGVMVPSDGFWHSNMFSDQVGQEEARGGVCGACMQVCS